MPKHYTADPAFYNGAEWMRKQVLDKLTNMKGKALGNERFLLDMLIKYIQKIETR